VGRIIRLVTATWSRTTSSTESEGGDEATATLAKGGSPADCAAASEVCSATITVTARATDWIGVMAGLLHGQW
jgi:hypothetical protein